MKRNFSILPMALALGLAMVWHGCEADVDLNNIDLSVKADADVAVPVGSMRATIGDFVGDGTWGIFVDSMENKGVLVFRDTFSISRNFHKIDISQYIGKADLKMNVYDKLADKGFLQDGKVTGTGVAIPLEFPFSLKLDGINNDESYQRLDSALIKNANFISKLGKLGGLPLEWEWIDKVTLTLGNAFHRQAGKEIVVYTKGDNYNFNQNIPINVDEFSINLMKNTKPTSWEGYSNNVIDSCDVNITMYINIPKGKVVNVPSTAAFQYYLTTQFIDYHAVWGMFKPSHQMSDEQEISLSEEWDAWKLFEAARLPFSDPKVDMKVTTEIAGALVMHGEYLYVKDNTGKQVNATFDGKESLYKYFSPNEYLGLDSKIGESATMHILFDKDPQRGHIDRLFTVQPENLGYKFSIDFNRQETPQIRIPNNTSIRIDAECDLPFKFNEGVKVAYSDTIKGIDLSVVQLDSLMQYVPELVDTIEEAKLTLALQFENSIPLQFKGSFECLDENNQAIIDPATGKPFQIIEPDTLVIPAPDCTFNQSALAWSVTPAEMVKTIEVEKDDLNTIAQIKKIVFHAALDDESLDYAYKQGYFNVKLTPYEGLRVKIGVGVSAEAVLNLKSLIEPEQ